MHVSRHGLSPRYSGKLLSSTMRITPAGLSLLATFLHRLTAIAHVADIGGFCIPPVRGEAVIYDASGEDILENVFLEYDNFLYSNVLTEYAEGPPMTEARLDRLAEDCHHFMQFHTDPQEHGQVNED